MGAIANIEVARKLRERKAKLRTWARVREPFWFPSFRLLMACFSLVEFPADPCIRRSGIIIDIETIPGGETMYKMFFATAGKNDTPITRSYAEEDLEFLGLPEL